YSGKGAGGACSDHQSINFSIHLLKKLGSRGLIVEIRVGGVLELPGHKAVATFRKFLCTTNSTCHTFAVRSSSHLRTQCLHNDDFLLRHSLRDKERNFVPAAHANQCQTNPRITGGGLDNRTPRIQQTLLLCFEDDSQSSPVFNAATRIQI